MQSPDILYSDSMESVRLPANMLTSANKAISDDSPRSLNIFGMVHLLVQIQWYLGNPGVESDYPGF